MIFNIENKIVQREKVLDYLADNKFDRVADVGGSLGPWAKEFVTHYFDIVPPYEMREGAVFIPYDLNQNKVVFDDFEFVICSQMLEHVYNPEWTLYLLSKLGYQGYIDVPNKITELTKGVAFSDEGLTRCDLTEHFRGFGPHRWLFTIKEDALWCFPKMNFLEYMMDIDEWVNKNPDPVALSFWWKDKIPCKMIDDTYLDFPDPQKAIEFYRRELFDGQ